VCVALLEPHVGVRLVSSISVHTSQFTHLILAKYLQNSHMKIRHTL
jgi:hypothetical protein